MAPALTQEYLVYYLQENWSMTLQEWIASFPKPLEVVNQLQSIQSKNVPVDAFIEAIRETIDTRGTCKRKLDKLAE